MLIISVCVTALLLVGFFLLSSLRPGSAKERLIASRDYSVKKIEDIRSRRKIPLKKQVEYITGKQKSNFLVQNFSEARDILRNSGTNREKQIRMINTLSVLLGLGGVAAALLFNNMFLAPTLGVGLALLPSWYVKITENFLRKHLNAELEVALSTITTSYVRNDNIIQAVEENLKYLKSPVRQVFAKFVNENKLINANVIYGLQKMKKGLDNPVFHEWCDAMMQCQNDRTLKVTLFPIVNKFSEMKSVQEELDTLLMIPLRDYLMVSLIVLVSIPFMRVLNLEWYAALVGTPIGKLILSLVSLCFFYGLNRAIGLSKPIEYRR